MWLKTVGIFLGLTCAQACFVGVLLWILDKMPDKSFWIFNFSSRWSFLAGAVLAMSPVILVVNYFVAFWYTFGYELFSYSNKIWPVQMLFLGSGPLAWVAMIYFWRGELPDKGNFVWLLLYVCGAIIAKLWK